MTAASTLSLPFSRGALELRQQYPVAFQPVGLDPALLHCGPDPAARLADVAAITVAALADEGPHLGKAAGQLPRLDAPESHLAESRRIHQEAPSVERQHHRGHRGVLAPAHPGADLPDPELESRLHGIEQAGFSGTGWAGHYGDASLQGFGKLIDALPGLGTGRVDHVARRAAALDELGARLELHLVHHHGGRYGIGFGYYEKPVDQLGNGSGIHGRGDHEDFIDVGRHRAGAAALGHPAFQESSAGLDADYPEDL